MRNESGKFLGKNESSLFSAHKLPIITKIFEVPATPLKIIGLNTLTSTIDSKGTSDTSNKKKINTVPQGRTETRQIMRRQMRRPAPSGKQHG